MTSTPFTNIALSLSGGGYRATTFHLGAMAYLDAKELDGNNLLENVKIISTISGGTLTGVMYAWRLAKGGNFQECFDKLYQLLSEDKLVDEALHKLNNPAKWKNKHKMRDVINAFAEVYNEQFYEEATFADLFDAPEMHLKDVIFGASEFTYGIQFRFQEEHDNGRFGNGYLSLSDEVAKEIRLADATASSSCFPGGFEPMIMPHDYGNGPDSAVEKEWYSKSHDGIDYQTTAIMDGGIIDNQGIEGVKLAEKRHAKKGDAFIGTYIVSDVSGEMMKPYQVPILKYKGWKNFITVNTISLVFLVIAVVLGVLLYTSLPLWGIISSSVVLTLMAIWFIIVGFVRRAIKTAIGNTFGESLVPELLKDFRVIRRTPIYILLYLIKFRVGSVMKMVSDLFLRRIRRLQLNTLYDDTKWNYRFKSNYIYSLLKYADDKKIELPKALKKVVDAANNMPTTLWFSEKEKKAKVLDDLIACGQLTMCFNLIRYAKRLKTEKYKKKAWDPLTPEQKQAIENLLASMEADWKKFESDPHWLLKKNIA